MRSKKNESTRDHQHLFQCIYVEAFHILINKIILSTLPLSDKQHCDHFGSPN
jgi:hypothetical protein